MICKGMCNECPYTECVRDKREKEVHKRYYRKNRAQRLDYQKAYNDAHREERNRKMREYRARLKET